MKKKEAVKVLEFLRHSSGCHFLVKKEGGWSVISDNRPMIYPDNGRVIARVGNGPSGCSCLGCPESVGDVEESDFTETLSEVDRILEIIEGIRGGKKINVSPGVSVMSSAEMAEEQEGWGQEDPEKGTDFSLRRYWIVTDDGQEPVGTDYPEEVIIITNLFDLNDF